MEFTHRNRAERDDEVRNPTILGQTKGTRTSRPLKSCEEGLAPKWLSIFESGPWRWGGGHESASPSPRCLDFCLPSLVLRHVSSGLRPVLPDVAACLKSLALDTYSFILPMDSCTPRLGQLALQGESSLAYSSVAGESSCAQPW